MSSYNNGDVHTEYIDPQIYVPNGRASFSLDASKLAYLPNLRMLNVGVSVDVATKYNRLVGSMACIRNIRLLDGRTELSALRNPAPYLAFKSQQRTNADNKSTASWFKNSMVGLEINELNDKLDHLYVKNDANTGQPNDGTADATDVGYLDLMECFPILGALPCLPTDVFPNLRVEIEFHSQPSAQIVVRAGKGGVAATATTSVRPILVADVVENPELVRALSRSLKESGARWNEIEHDRFNMLAPDLVADEKKVSSEQSMAFIGKRVERLLMCKRLQDPALSVNAAGDVLGYGNLASQALQAQTTQVRLNGKNVFPGFNGISRPMERLALVSDEYGACSAYPGSNLYNWTLADSMVKLGGPGGGASETGKTLSGALSYDCVRIGAKVADLQIQISRTSDGTAFADGTVRATNDPLIVDMFAEVDKAMVMGRDGQYRIVYA